METVSEPARKEIVGALRDRYEKATKEEKGRLFAIGVTASIRIHRTSVISVHAQYQIAYSPMKYLSLLLLLVVTSCASRPKPQVVVWPISAAVFEPVDSVRFTAPTISLWT